MFKYGLVSKYLGENMNQKFILSMMLMSALIISGCAFQNNTNNNPKICAMDAKICPDGSSVGRDSNSNCEFSPCPNPEVRGCTEDAKVCPDGTTVARDPDNSCEFQKCPEEKNRKYMSKDANDCKLILYQCIPGSDTFSDETGCGCEFDWTQGSDTGSEGKLKVNDCLPEQRNMACTKEYMPVCGWFNRDIQCIKYPCAATFGNRCDACSDENIAYWTEGECPSG